MTSYRDICLQALRSGPKTCMEISRIRSGHEEPYVGYRVNLSRTLFALEYEGLIERHGYTEHGILWKLKNVDTVYIKIRTCGLTLGQMMDAVHELIRKHPDEEIFMDGDAFAIVGRTRKVSQ